MRSGLHAPQDALAEQAVIQFTVRLRHLGVAMAVCAVFFTLVGAAIVAAKFGYRFDKVYGLYSLFDLQGDSSVPTWYASLSLLICSALLAANGMISRRRALPHTRRWLALAVIFLMLSIDETARIHEVLGGFVGAKLALILGQGGGWFNFSWVFAGAAFTAVIAMAYVPFLFSLPRRIAIGFVMAGVIYVGGALFTEMLNAHSEYLYGVRSVTYQLGSLLEESLEMAGIALLAQVLVVYLVQQTQGAGINVLLDLRVPVEQDSAAERSVTYANAGSAGSADDVTT